MKNKKVQSAIIAGVGISLIASSVFFTPNQPKNVEGKVNNIATHVYLSDKPDEFFYLSDIPYVKELSKAGWKTIAYDQNLDGNTLSLIVDGTITPFFKGIIAHATSTVVYDLTDYDYDYFTAYLGIDSSMSGKGNGVKFYIYTSVDGKNWELKTSPNPAVTSSKNEAEFVKVDIKNAKYLKLYAHDNGGNAQDHAVYANAKLIKEGYKEENLDFIKTVAQYDELIKAKGIHMDLSNPDDELLLLQRTFVKNAGYATLQAYGKQYEEYKETIEWLMNDQESLNLYLMGGKPAGNYPNALKVLVELYQNYRHDWDNTEVSNYGAIKGQVYKRMAFALSLTHSTRVALWMQPGAKENQSDAVTRYAIFKKLYDEGKFKVNDTIDITPWFENYTVEEMRFVMNTALDDEEILWLHDYTQTQIEKNPSRAWSYLTPHPYMAYVWPNYANPVFHDETRKEYWDRLYDGIFSKYGVTYSTEGNMVYKVWMNLRTEFGTGAVCGGISKTGSNIRAVHGIPAAVIGQPGHAAIIYYHQNAEGKGYWNIDNDVSGWTLSEKGERMLLGWGNDSRYVRGYNVPYIIMAQEAINRFEDYEKSAKAVLLADVYQTDSKLREYYLREAIKFLDFNVDAWYELMALYLGDETKTEEDLYNLATEMSEAFIEFPLPFYNLITKMESKFTSNAYKFKYSLLLTSTLNKGKNYNGTDVLQPAATRLLASYLLGKTDSSLALFSFDGENAGKIILSDRFNKSGIRWDYSLDGKQTWHEVAFTAEEEHELQLTKEELDHITEENDIYVHIVGVNYSEENVFKIDIQRSTLPTTLFNNDLENRVIGVDDTYEWRMNENEVWTSFKDRKPNLEGNQSVEVRIGATGTYLPSDFQTFTFTEDHQDDTRKYVSIDHLSIKNVSTEATGNQGHARNAIDGNYNTRYHSAWNGTDQERYMTIKLDEAMYISAVEFIPAGGGNGKILDGTVYGSIDGKNWIELSKLNNVRYTNQTNSIEDAIANAKTFIVSEPQKVQYIKIVADNATQGHNMAPNGNWFTARAFNLYQDITIKEEIEPTPSITPVPTVEPTPVPTTTPLPTVTPTPRPTEEPNPTPTEEPTPTETPKPTVEPTPVPTTTPLPTVTPTPRPTEEPKPTEKPIPTETPKPTVEPTPVPTPIPTIEPTASITPTPTPTNVPIPTASPIATMTPIPTATVVPTVTPTIVPTSTPKETNKPAENKVESVKPQATLNTSTVTNGQEKEKHAEKEVEKQEKTAEQIQKDYYFNYYVGLFLMILAAAIIIIIL